jgi:phosphate transport system permease protein
MTTAAERKQIIQDAVVKTHARRRITDKVITGVTIACVAAALIPLGSILFEVFKNGAAAVSFDFLTKTPGRLTGGFITEERMARLVDEKMALLPEEQTAQLTEQERALLEEEMRAEVAADERARRGGLGPSIQGTLIVVGLASLIAIPVGVLGGIYLSEYAGTGKFPYMVRFLNNVMTGLPSIVVGIVGYIILVVTIGSFNVMAGAVALSIIMIPIVLGVTEQTLKLVPNSVREAGHSLGIPKWRVTLSITLTSAKSGVLTGIVLGISRIAGETAPLIMTILGTSIFFQGFFEPTAGLPLSMWRLSQQPYEASHEFAWGGALILILIILSLSVALRYLVLEKRFRFRASTFTRIYAGVPWKGRKTGGSRE